MTNFTAETPFSPSSRLWDLIEDNSELLLAISRFGIPLGFGNATVQEVCDRNNVNCPTFLAVVNYLSDREVDETEISLRTLMDYLKGSHSYFLEFLLPTIRRKLIEAVHYGNSDAEVSMLLLKFFDSYVDEIDSHMTYENNEVFTYIEKLLQGEKENIRVPEGLFTDRHDNVAKKLNELKDIIVRYVPQRNSNLINSALHDIIDCEKEILQHCGIEDRLFEPAVRKLEATTGSTRNEKMSHKKEALNVTGYNLSDREKEIIKLVACGLSNKEIAEKLFLSVHTVTTHRRNLSAKLDIHSPAALTIFAVMNHLVDLEDIRNLGLQ